MIFNMVGGGGGSLKATDALLRVQAPAGSTVTISKGTTTKTGLGHENADDNSVYDYYFIIHQSQFDSVNPWTITATLGSKTANSTIVINASDAYNVEIIYNLYLIKNGIEQVTFVTSNCTKAAYSGFIKYESDNSTYISYFKIGNIDVTRFSTIELDIVDTGFSWNGKEGQAPGMGYSSSDPTFSNTNGAVSPYDAAIKFNNSTGAINANAYTLDVSNVTGNKYIWVLFSAGSGTPGTISISDFKLIPI